LNFISYFVISSDIQYYASKRFRFTSVKDHDSALILILHRVVSAHFCVISGAVVLVETSLRATRTHQAAFPRYALHFVGYPIGLLSIQISGFTFACRNAI